MPARNAMTLFRFRGIRIGVDYTWFFVLFLVILYLSGVFRSVLGATQEDIAPYAYAVVTALLFFGSILLHELGHALVALRRGIGISDITLWLFGGVALMTRDSDSPGTEFKIAIAGPLVTLAIAIACLGAGIAIAGPDQFSNALASESGVSGLLALLAWLGAINALILVFNLFPAFPLDGGRIVRAAAWRLSGDRNRATRAAAMLGQAFSYFFIGAGIALVVATDATLTGVWLGLIGFILLQAARSHIVQAEIGSRIADLSVADVMDSEPVAIPSGASVERALDEYFLRYRWPWFPVVDAADRFLGLIVRDAADAVPERVRGSQTVSDLIERDTDGRLRVLADEPLENLLGNDALRRLGALAAVDADGRLRGVITAAEVGRALRGAVQGE